LAVVAPVDMRLGADGLSLRLQALGADPFDGSAYLFTNKRANRLKALAWDGNGVWLCQRRLLPKAISLGPGPATRCFR
jgi:transposase